MQMLCYLVEIWEQYLNQHLASAILPCIVSIWFITGHPGTKVYLWEVW